MSRRKGSNPIALGIIALILLAMLGLLGYYLYFLWGVFGFWRLTVAGLLTGVLFVSLLYLSKRKHIDGDTITYNPRELPLFLAIVVMGALNYYLYSYLTMRFNQAEITDVEHAFGIVYLVFQSLPLLRSLVAFIRDRNDFIQFSPEGFEYKDNHLGDLYPWSSIAGLQTRRTKKRFFAELRLTNGTCIIIHLDQMNMKGFSRSEIDEIALKYIREHRATSKTEESEPELS